MEQAGICRGSEKWSDSRYIMKMKITEFADKLYLECEEKQLGKDYYKLLVAQ